MARRAAISGFKTPQQKAGDEESKRLEELARAQAAQILAKEQEEKVAADAAKAAHEATRIICCACGNDIFSRPVKPAPPDAAEMLGRTMKKNVHPVDGRAAIHFLSSDAEVLGTNCWQTYLMAKRTRRLQEEEQKREEEQMARVRAEMAEEMARMRKEAMAEQEKKIKDEEGGGGGGPTEEFEGDEEQQQDQEQMDEKEQRTVPHERSAEGDGDGAGTVAAAGSSEIAPADYNGHHGDQAQAGEEGKDHNDASASAASAGAAVEQDEEDPRPFLNTIEFNKLEPDKMQEPYIWSGRVEGKKAVERDADD